MLEAADGLDTRSYDHSHAAQVVEHCGAKAEPCRYIRSLKSDC